MGAGALLSSGYSKHSKEVLQTLQALQRGAQPRAAEQANVAYRSPADQAPHPAPQLASEPAIPGRRHRGDLRPQITRCKCTRAGNRIFHHLSFGPLELLT
eukprot:7178993-Prymnesium_polylepis.1